MIELLLYLACTLGTCHVEALMVTPEAVAVATCESGDTVNFGSHEVHARSATNDGGIWQFNDKTYVWLTGRDHAELDTYRNQYAAFLALWNGGRGWRHWRASQPCWSQWLMINDEGRAVWQ